MQHLVEECVQTLVGSFGSAAELVANLWAWCVSGLRLPAVVAETDYGGPVTAMIAKGNMAGTQFHPEKSQTLGLKLIANFLRWKP